MDKKLFADLLASVKEMKAAQTGRRKPGREVKCNPDEKPRGDGRRRKQPQ